QQRQSTEFRIAKLKVGKSQITWIMRTSRTPSREMSKFHLRSASGFCVNHMEIVAMHLQTECGRNGTIMRWSTVRVSHKNSQNGDENKHYRPMNSLCN